MYVVILVGIFAILFAYLESSERTKNGLKIAFFLIIVFQSIRYDFGNDYMNYLNSFYRYQYYSGSLLNFEELKDMQGHGDFGWVILCILFAPIGFFGMIMLLSVLENWIIYDFVKTYVPKSWYPFALFIYVFNPNIMVMGGSMMRQWLAMCIFVFAFRFIRDKKPILYFICIIVAMSIHGSSKILLPIFFLSYLRNFEFSTKSLLWFVPALVVWFLVAPSLFLSNINVIMGGDEMERFSDYTEGSGERYGVLGIVASFLFPIVCISQIKKFDTHYRLLILIFFLSILIRPLGLVIAMVLRLCFYFMIFSIVVFPLVLEKIANTRRDYMIVLLAIIIIPILRDFYAFFHSETWIEKFTEYHTIIGLQWQ